MFKDYFQNLAFQIQNNKQVFNTFKYIITSIKSTFQRSDSTNYLSTNFGNTPIDTINKIFTDLKFPLHELESYIIFREDDRTISPEFYKRFITTEDLSFIFDPNEQYDDKETILKHHQEEQKQMIYNFIVYFLKSISKTLNFTNPNQFPILFYIDQLDYYINNKNNKRKEQSDQTQTQESFKKQYDYFIKNDKYHHS